jgi:hypothetical protein
MNDIDKHHPELYLGLWENLLEFFEYLLSYDKRYTTCEKFPFNLSASSLPFLHRHHVIFVPLRLSFVSLDK